MMSICPSVSLVSPSRWTAGLGGDPRVLEKHAVFRERGALESSAIEDQVEGVFEPAIWGKLLF